MSEADLKASCALCGFNAEDAAVLTWWTGLDDGGRRELLKLSRVAAKKLATVGGLVTEAQEQREAMNRSPQKSVRIRSMIRADDAR
jgi:hypothetical protein